MGAPPDSSVTVRFYAELNDFLPRGRRSLEVVRRLCGPTSVKDVIESAGVPHTEVDLVLVDGVSVDFAHRVEPGDRIAVYPMFEAFDVAAVTRVRPVPLRDPRFVLDVHLGRLAAYLRLAGFDAAQPLAASDETLAALSVSERRILLTRDQGLLKRRAVTHGHYVRATVPVLQLREVVERFDLAGLVRPFSRCLRCNEPLVPVTAAEAGARVPPRVLAAQLTFTTCPRCRRVFWAGTHHERMRRLLGRVLANPAV